MTPNSIVGQQFDLEMDISIEVLQVKLKDDEKYWVTYLVTNGPGIPRKLVMDFNTFVDTFGSYLK